MTGYRIKGALEEGGGVRASAKEVRVSNSRWHSAHEMFGEAREAGNVVIGALVGAYLGLAVATDGVGQGKYFALGKIVISLAMFVMSINAVGDRAHRLNFSMAALYAMLALVFGVLAYRSASQLGVDANIVLTALICWVILVSFEIATLLSALSRVRKAK